MTGIMTTLQNNPYEEKLRVIFFQNRDQNEVCIALKVLLTTHQVIYMILYGVHNCGTRIPTGVAMTALFCKK